jgi:hypothetical protein
MKSLYPFSATFITRLSILFVLFLGAAVSHHLQAQIYRFANASSSGSGTGLQRR